MESVWMQETKIGNREALPGDLEVPVVVIGAGLAGILTAYYLKQAGIRAVVLEADRIGSGQTKNTTAKITSQHDLVYDRIIRMFGRRMAQHYADANEAAIREYKRLISEKEIDCDFIECPACLYSCTGDAVLKREAEAARSLGIRASFQTDCELPFQVAGVTRFERQANFHPLKFLAAMAEEVEVYEQTKALKVEDARVETDRGCVSAQHIVFASHYPFINVPGYYFARMYQERSYVVALRGAERPEGMYLGIDQDGLSFRTCGNLLLLGGGSHRTGLNKGCRYGELRDRAQAIYPGCQEKSHWSAQDCMTPDGLPYIGRFSVQRPNWYVATGFGKWGMTTSMVSARILTELIGGRDCPQADIFSPQRHFTVEAAKELIVHGAHTVKGLAKHLLPSGNDSVIPNCPHMGCRLEKNPDEESYDCPCHGSRFDREGHLLDGPAQTDCRRRGSFYGWYFKCQSDTQTLAVIPAVHRTGRKRDCSVQVITEKKSWAVALPAEAFRREGKTIFIGKNRFGEKGIRLDICAPELNVRGEITFGALHPLKYDIMGPFALVPFLECRHSVWSMKHIVQGSVDVNGTAYVFDGGDGYWEGDRGRSFPKEYIWTQCSFPEGALMLSVADIPIAGYHFRGVIGIVLLHGKEYRLATYLGAKAVAIGDGRVRVMQGNLALEAELLERNGKPLQAPVGGNMVRTIRESAACRARYRFWKDGRTLLSFVSKRASFEYEYCV